MMRSSGIRPITTALWYFDTVSPYAYLHLKQFHRLRPELAIEYVPVLFAGMLRHWGTKGPVEVPAKRIHTYRQCYWLAQRLGVSFKLPPRHPYNPLSVLRLLIAIGSAPGNVEKAFDFIFGQGRDPEMEFSALAEHLGVVNADALIADPVIKQKLRDNTSEAIARGVFGVPTMIVNDELFWGSETIDWLNQYLENPAMFSQGEMARLNQIKYG